MAKITLITLSKNRKFSLPKYENVDIGVSITYEPEAVADRDFIWEEINKEIRRQARKYPDAIGPDLDPEWIGNGKKTKRAKKGNLSTKTKR